MSRKINLEEYKQHLYLPKVHPQFKALVYFDKNILEVDGRHDYSMSGTFRTVAMDAINSIPVLIPAGSTSAKSYIPLGRMSRSRRITSVEPISSACGSWSNISDIQWATFREQIQRRFQPIDTMITA